MTSSPCTVCGATAFKPGHEGRLTNGLPPWCSVCNSLERHRIVRALYNQGAHLFRHWSALQFAPDTSTDPNWFREFHGAVYGMESGVDMMDTGFADGAFDMVISNHVLEHVADDAKALREMARIVSPPGIIHLTVPSPAWRWETIDWQFADPAKNWHYRDYGADFPSYVCNRLPDWHALSVVSNDPVTGLVDILYLFSRSSERLAALAEVWQRVPVAMVWQAPGRTAT